MCAVAIAIKRWRKTRKTRWASKLDLWKKNSNLITLFQWMVLVSERINNNRLGSARTHHMVQRAMLAIQIYDQAVPVGNSYRSGSLACHARRPSFNLTDTFSYKLHQSILEVKKSKFLYFIIFSIIVSQRLLAFHISELWGYIT